MSAKFVMLANPHNNKPVLVNSDHVRTGSESAPNVVTLVMDGGLHQNVEGNLKSVWAKLEEQRSVGEQKRSPFRGNRDYPRIPATSPLSSLR
jgi:hypothetical protein